MERGAKTEQEIKDLRDNERQLQLRIAQAEEDKTSIMTEAERVIEEIEILKENFEQAKVDNARHQELAKELTTEVQGLTDELREAADENVKLRTEVQVLLAERKEAKVLKQEIDRLRDEQPMSPNMKQKIVRLKGTFPCSFEGKRKAGLLLVALEIATIKDQDSTRFIDLSSAPHSHNSRSLCLDYFLQSLPIALEKISRAYTERQ